METIKHQNKDYKLLIAKVFVFASLFSIILSYSSLFAFYIIQLFTYNIHKNYMFLLCNGILVFIAKFSGLVSNSKLHHDYYTEIHPVKTGYKQRELRKSIDENRVFVAEENRVCIVAEENRVSVVAEENRVCIVAEENRVSVVAEEHRVYVSDEGIEVESEEVKEMEYGYLKLGGEVMCTVEDGDEEEESEEDDDDREELNKKCEEFIRKMRERIKFDDRRVSVA